MPKIEITAVGRAGAYSPNHIGNDAAILLATIDNLRRRGCSVTLYNEEDFRALKDSEIADTVLNMCRKEESIRKLQQLEESGHLVVNSGFGIENCTRELMTRQLIGNGIPYPESLIVDTNRNILDEMESKKFEAVWIKRGDFFAMHKEDVSYCRHPQEAQEVLHEFFLRGIPRAVINRHISGDLIKFYGIRDTIFFYHFYPFDVHHSKYGWEEVNGKSHNFHYDENYLQQICQRAAEILNVEIYGGDCIISADGSITIIDFNDWPSFAPCRSQAAPIIAKTILTKIKQHIKNHNDR